MLISACQGTFNGASAFLWHCNTNCKLHSYEGHGRLPFLLSRAVCVRSFAVAAMLLQRAAKGALFVFFCCYCLRVGALVCAFALFEAVYLPFARLFLLLQYFAHLARFRAFMLLVLYCSRVCCSLFCAPSVRRINARRGKGGGTAGVQAHRRRGCVYSLRSPSASRCSFSAIR